MNAATISTESNTVPQVGNPLLGQIREFIEADEPAPIDPVGIVVRAVRGRGHRIGVIILIVALMLALSAWISISPGYQSVGVVRILPREAKLLYTDLDDSRLRLYDAFTNAEVQLMQARPVLELAWSSLRDQADENPDHRFAIPKDISELSQILSISNRKGLVTVTAKSADPYLSAGAVNAILSAYQTHKDRARERVNQVRRSELEGREAALARSLQDLDAQYLEIGGEHDVTSLSKAHIAKTAQLEILEERIGELDNTIDQFERTGAIGADDIRNAEIQRALLLDQALAEMTYERANRLAELSTLRSRYRPTHNKIVTAEVELSTLEGAIDERQDQITTLGNVGALTGGTSQSSEQSLDELLSVKEKLLGRRILLTSEANTLISKLVKIRRVVAEQRRVGDLLDETKRALDEVIVESQAGLSRSIDVIARGKVPDRPVNEKRKPIALVAAVFGAIATFLCFVLTSIIQPRIRYTDDLKPDLARKVAIAIPDEQGTEAAGNDYGIKLRNEIDVQRTAGGESIVVAVSGTTAAANTSAIAVSLADIYSEGKTSVLLIDASASPRVTAQFGLEEQTGLSDVIRGRLSLAETVETVTTTRARFDVLSAGSVTNDEPRNRITSYTLQDFRDLITGVRTNYDVILLDLGQISAGHHSALAASVSDQLIHTVSAGDSKRSTGATCELIDRIIPDRYLLVFDRASPFDPMIDTANTGNAKTDWASRFLDSTKARLEAK